MMDKRIMRVVIIGGTGLIGKALKLELEANGHRVTITSRKRNLDGESGTVHWDGVHTDDLCAIIEGKDAVINLAGENIGARPWTKKRKQEILDSRVIGTGVLAQAMEKTKQSPKVVIQASAVGFYGTASSEVDESSPQGSDWLAQVCEAWEAPIREVKSRVIVIRSGVVLAKGSGILSRLELPIRLFLGGPLGSGKQWISWIHIQDEVRAIRFLLENEELSGVINLAAPEQQTNSQFGKVLAEVLHRPFWLPVPSFILRIILGELSMLVLEGQKVQPKRLIQSGFRFQYPELKSALRDLAQK